MPHSKRTTLIHPPQDILVRTRNSCLLHQPPTIRITHLLISSHQHHITSLHKAPTPFSTMRFQAPLSITLLSLTISGFITSVAATPAGPPGCIQFGALFFPSSDTKCCPRAVARPFLFGLQQCCLPAGQHCDTDASCCSGDCDANPPYKCR